MNRQNIPSILMIVSVISLLGLLGARSAQAEEPKAKTDYGYCRNLTIEDIPEGDFSSIPWPQEKPDGKPVFRVTQTYNQTYEEGWTDANGNRFWGHDGIDVHEHPSVGKGINYNIALQHGKVIAAMKGYQDVGWGYRMTIATRVPHSHQVITFNYAHMHKDSLFFNPCEPVQKGARIGKEGDTGWGTGSHLHLSVRLWDGMEKLNKAIEKDAKAKAEDGGAGLFESGYVYNNTARLANYLSPYHLITDKFLEFECNDPGCPFWAKSHSLAARRAGLDFGRYDGYFAVDTTQGGEPFVEFLTRGESARWFKVGRKMQTTQTQSSTFTDISQNDIHHPYVETLIKNGVLSSTTDCNLGSPGKQWCPDIPRTRAELIKMIVGTFMGSEFTQWQLQALAGQHGDKFASVKSGGYFADLYDEGYHWATTYVLFAALGGSIPSVVKPVDVALHFRPEDPVDKLEAVKMLMAAREWYFGKYGAESQYNLCDYHHCGINEKCVVLPEQGYYGPYYVSCISLPGCVPEEGGRDDCEYGGGYIPDECGGNPSPVCQSGETKSQPCGNGGTQSAVCTSQCLWSTWGDCLGGGTCSAGQTQPCGNCGTMTCQSNFQWGICQNEGICSAGQTQSQSCNGTGTQMRTCLNSCTWGSWSTCSVQQVCSPGQTQTQNCTVGGQPGTQSRICDAYGQWGVWSSCQSSCVCQSGICCDGCYYKSSNQVCNSWNEYRCAGTSPGDDAQYMNVTQYCSGASSNCSGTTSQTPWYTLENCSTSQQCIVNGTMPTCVDMATCTDVYYPSSQTACFDQNPNGVEICLKLQKVSGSSYKFQICKTGTFQNNFSYELKDILNPSYSPISTGTGSAGISCTDWKTINFSYIPGYGTSNGATIRADVKSPANTGTLYRSSIMNVYKQCL